MTKEVHRLPMEEYVSREELQQCTLHQLRVRLPPCICQRLIAPACATRCCSAQHRCVQLLLINRIVQGFPVSMVLLSKVMKVMHR